MLINFISFETEKFVLHFRLAGRSLLIKQLKEVFDSGEQVEFVIPEIDVHSVASLLKLYLRELPEPIVPPQFYEPVMKIVQRDMHVNPDKAMNSLQALLTHIPKCNYNLIQYLTHFLHDVSSKSDVNKMTAMNLATVFVHCMIRPEDEDPALLMGTANGRTQVTFIFIAEWEKLFKMEYNALGTAVKVEDLLDIDASGKTGKVFNPDTSTPVGQAEVKTPNELLDLVLSTDQGDVPEPLLVPATDGQAIMDKENGEAVDKTTERPESDHEYATIDDDRIADTNSGLYAAITDLDPYSTINQGMETGQMQRKSSDRSQPPIPARPAPLPPRSISNTEISSTTNDNTSPPEVLMRSKSGSIPKPRPRKMSGTSSTKDVEQTDICTRDVEGDGNSASGPPPTPPKPKAASFSGSPSTESKGMPDRPVPARPAPPPPVNTSNTSENHHYDEIQDVCEKKSLSLTSGKPESKKNSVDVTDSTFTNCDTEDESTSELINTNTEDFTHDELQNFISKLKTELLNQSNRAKEIRSKLCEKHKEQLQDMGKKVENEKLASANAVEKIISLQHQLQKYSMKYGGLD